MTFGSIEAFFTGLHQWYVPRYKGIDGTCLLIPSICLPSTEKTHMNSMCEVARQLDMQKM